MEQGVLGLLLEPASRTLILSSLCKGEDLSREERGQGDKHRIYSLRKTAPHIPIPGVVQQWGYCRIRVTVRLD